MRPRVVAWNLLALQAGAVNLYLRRPNTTESLLIDHQFLRVLDWDRLWDSAGAPFLVRMSPRTTIDVSDSDAVSMDVYHDPGAWSICAAHSLSPSSAACIPLSTGESPRVLAPVCDGFTALAPEAYDVTVWLQRNAPLSPHGAPHGAWQSAKQVFRLDRTPTGGSKRAAPDGSLVVSVPVTGGGAGATADLDGVWSNASFDALSRQAQAFAAAHPDVKKCAAAGDGDEEVASAAPAWEHALDHMLAQLAAPLCLPDRRHGKDGEGGGGERLARVLVLGDSHADLFFAGRYSQESSQEGSLGCSPSNYYVCSIASATAYGLDNASSSSGGLVGFRKCLDRFSGEGSVAAGVAVSVGGESAGAGDARADVVAVLLGEVDLRSLLPKRAAKGITAVEQIRASTDALLRFAKREIVDARGYQWDQVLLLGAPFKCPHATERGDHLLVHTETGVRTQAFNAALRDACRGLGCTFANPADDLVDYADGAVKSFFWSTPRDWHCSPMRLFFFWHRAVASAAELDWCEDDARVLAH